MQARRNDPCPCGSGKKYKHCCAVKAQKSQLLGTIGVAAFILITGFVIAEVIRGAKSEQVVPEGYVWSEEHGHLHRVEGGAGGDGIEPPAGATWSDEHGHYHGPDGRAITWNAAQGVWLNEDGIAIP
ncbi:MAG: hypothetical protein GWO02_04805 [Gammaproteobacteria bacterium]|nr:hypothetical protein [Gammaproteobacteria bacterium]